MLGVGLFFRVMAADGTLDAVTHAGGPASGTFGPRPTSPRPCVTDPSSSRTRTCLTAAPTRPRSCSAMAGTVHPSVRVSASMTRRMSPRLARPALCRQGGVHPCPFPWDTPDRQRPCRPRCKPSAFSRLTQSAMQRAVPGPPVSIRGSGRWSAFQAAGLAGQAHGKHDFHAFDSGLDLAAVGLGNFAGDVQA